MHVGDDEPPLCGNRPMQMPDVAELIERMRIAIDVAEALAGDQKGKDHAKKNAAASVAARN
jgi:hypothetical protein